MASEPQHISRSKIDPLLLQSILSSQPFVRSQRMCRFLTLLVDRANNPDPNGLKETEIGVLVFDRTVGYDPKVDSIVRTEATRLRRKLSEYYADEGRTAPYRLHLPPGRYELELLPHVQPVPVQTPVASPAPSPAHRRSRIASWLALSCGLALVALIAWRLQPWAGRTATLTPFTYFPGLEARPAFSPDGKRIAYTWDGETSNVPAVYVQALGSDTPVRLTHSDAGEYAPVWSPDGTRIAFLRRISLTTLELRTVRADAATGDTWIATLAARANTDPGLTWSPDGVWLLTAEPANDNSRLRLVSIRATTGEKRPFRSAPEKASLQGPVFSPDGRSIAYLRSPDTAVEDIFVSGFPAGAERQVTFDHTLIYGMNWSGNSELVVSSARGGQRPTLWRVPLHGTPVRLTETSEASVSPAVSPDGSIIAFARAVENINIWRRRLDSASPVDAGAPWLASSGLNSSPQFSPDGSSVAFRSTRTGPNEVWIANSGGTGLRKLTSMSGAITGSPRWSPDGRWIAFDSRSSGNSDIWVVAAAGGTPRRLTPENTNESLPSWSRDGRFIYYNSDRTGIRSMWRRPAGGGDPQLIREHACAGWESPDGRYIYYVHSPSEPGLFRAPISGGPEEAVIPTLSAGMWGNWAFARDGLIFVDWLDGASGREAWAQLQTNSGDIKKLFRISHPVRFDGALAVSPDNLWLAYAQQDRVGSDILLMKDWR